MSEVSLAQLVVMVTAFREGLCEGKPLAAAMLDPAPRELIDEYNRLRNLASNKGIENLPGELSLQNKPSYSALMASSAVLEAAVTPAKPVTIQEILAKLDEEIQTGKRPSMLEKLKELSEKNRSK